jgi:hypothetical protein
MIKRMREKFEIKNKLKGVKKLNWRVNLKTNKL